MGGWKEKQLRQLEDAIETVRESGEDGYICTGLSIAKDIIEAGPDVDAVELTRKILNDFGL